MAWTDVATQWWARTRISGRFTRDLVIGLVVGVTLSLSSTSLALLFQNYRRKRAISRIPPRPIELRSDEIVDGVIGLIGTPLTCEAHVDREYSSDSDKLVERRSRCGNLGTSLRSPSDPDDDREKPRCVA